MSEQAYKGMRVLTVRQPWAWAIVYGGKDVENRIRNIAGAYRGPVAIHVALALADVTEEQNATIGRAVGRLSEGGAAGLGEVVARIGDADERGNLVARRFGHRGAIIGVVDLVDVHTADDTWLSQSRKGLWPLCSQWAERSGYHLVLDNPRPLVEPVPFTGALGLRMLGAHDIERVLVGLGQGNE